MLKKNNWIILKFNSMKKEIIHPGVQSILPKLNQEM